MYSIKVNQSFLRFSWNSISFCCIIAASFTWLAVYIASYPFSTSSILSAVVSVFVFWDINSYIIFPFIIMSSIHFSKFDKLFDIASKFGLLRPAICAICWNEAITFSLLSMLFILPAINSIFIPILCKFMAELNNNYIQNVSMLRFEGKV